MKVLFTMQECLGTGIGTLKFQVPMKRAEKSSECVDWRQCNASFLDWCLGNNVVGGVPIKKIKDIENDMEGLG